jgi:hypothetical protein
MSDVCAKVNLKETSLTGVTPEGTPVGGYVIIQFGPLMVKTGQRPGFRHWVSLNKAEFPGWQTGE